MTENPVQNVVQTPAQNQLEKRTATSGAPAARAVEEEAPAFQVERLNMWYGKKQALFDVTTSIPSKTITAIIGPSGCGKSTFLRCLNRRHELVPQSRTEGSVR